MNRYQRYEFSRALRTVPLDRLESRRDYLAHRLEQRPHDDGDDLHDLKAEHQAITDELRRRSRPSEIARAIRDERFHPDHYQPSEHRRGRRRGRKRRRRFDRNLPH